jgi:ParB-like chromosome segregation protein Spo0J
MRQTILQEHDPRALQPNPWNTNAVSPDNEAKIDASIRRLGMFKPIIVRTLTDGSLQILGGAHRRDAAIRLGMDQVPVVNLGTVDDNRAKEIGIVDNGRYGEDDTLALAELLSSLGAPEDLAEFLPFSDADFNSIFASTTIALDELELPDDDGAPPAAPAAKPAQTHAVMRFKVPVGDDGMIADAIARVQKQQGFTDEDAMSNAGNALVHIFKSAGY